MPKPEIQHFEVLGIPISVTTPASTVAMIDEWAKDDQGRYVCIRDVHGLMLARKDPKLREIHSAADLVTPDGMPLAIIGKRRGLPVERTTGPDLMLDCLNAPDLTHFLYGGAEAVAQELAGRFPKANIAGVETPPFRPIDGAELSLLAKRIRESEADIVWIGLSTPKQEYLMARLAPLISATLIGVGAAFDIHTGRVSRPPQWVRNASLEGVYRVLREPRRLWRRYLILAPKFLVLAGVEQLSGRWKAKARDGLGANEGSP